MDGFGYPMIDWIYNVVHTKGRDMYESTKKIMSLENVEKSLKLKDRSLSGKTMEPSGLYLKKVEYEKTTK